MGKYGDGKIPFCQECWSVGKIGMGKTYHPFLQAELPVALSEVWILEDYCRGLEVFRGI